jgi:hypothetical protein
VLHADLHNHSDLSDGFGHAGDAFASMRAAGLDAAALTDHSGISDRDGRVDAALLETLRRVSADPGMPAKLMGDAGYTRAGELADLAEEIGGFAAVRGFEWTTPHIGHVNVWFAPDWTPVRDVGPLTGMGVLRDWISAAAEGPGGAEVLAGFNHPGREPLRFDGFAFDSRLADRIVSLELFNRDWDYLFEGVPGGASSPLVECLAAGWWTGLIGVSDEHTPHWGFQPGRGRTGVWVREWSRAGLREALAARRVFATREPGLRLDVVAAWADGARVRAPEAVAGRADAVRMGQRLAVGDRRAGSRADGRAAGLAVDLAVDVDGGPGWLGRDVVVQVLTTGVRVPECLAELPARSGEPVTVQVPVRTDGSTPWFVVRVADPGLTSDRPGPAGHPANLHALAYASPVGVVHTTP